MDMYFYGAGNIGLEALTKYESLSDKENQFVGFIDRNNQDNYKGYPVYVLEDISPKDEVIVITIGDHFIVRDVYLQLKKAGYKKIYWYINWEHTSIAEDFLTATCISCGAWGDYVIPRVEMHVADHCNLNCKGCTHYAPIFDKNFPDLDDCINSIQILKRKSIHIMVLSLLGGEPFLNKELSSYIEKICEILPNTCIQIVSNGLLIPSLGNDILHCISEKNVIVRVSEYEPTTKIRNKIEDKLQEYNISYFIQPYDDKQKFNKPLSLSEKSVYSHECISNGCVNIWEGKIARCPSLMFVERFNKYFGVKLPKEGIIKLENCPSGKELLDALEREVPLCKHCVHNEMSWGQCKQNPKIDDFAVVE